MGRTLTVIAVGLILLGVVALVGPTFGFSTIASDRGVSVSTANSSAAFVGLTAIEEVEIDGQNDPKTIVELENNLPNDATYTFDAAIPAGLTVSDQSDIDPGEELTLGPEDEPAAFVLECDGASGESDDSAWTSLTVEEADTGAIHVRDATVGTSLEYECPGPDSADIELVDDETKSDNGIVSFNLENTGNRDFRINQIAVDHDGSEIISEIVADDESDSPTGNEEWPTNGDMIEVGQGNSGLATIDSGETISVRLEFDVDDMEDESFEFTIDDTRGNGGEETVMVDVP